MQAVRTIPFRRWSKTILTVLIVHTLYRDHSNDIDRSKNAQGPFYCYLTECGEPSVLVARLASVYNLGTWTN
jgi:hypothetical protein